MSRVSNHRAISRPTLLSTGIMLAMLSACSGDSDDTEVVLDDAYYAALAQNFEAFVPDPSIGAAQDPEDFIAQGRWGDVIDWPEIASGAANLPDGRLMTWSSTSKKTFGGPEDFTFGSIYDPATGVFTEKNNNYHNTFCAGISMLPDGRTIAAGGGETITKTSVFDLATNDWALTEEMNIPRWYPTTTTLANGQVITALGTNNPYSEIWTEGSGWDVRTNLSLQTVLSDNSAPSSQRNWYPTLTVAPDGSLFHAGPTSELFSLYVGEDEGLVSHGKRENGDPFRLYNTTVMYDVGKMLIGGGGKPALASAMTIDLNGATPEITATNPMNYPRSMHNSVVLPDGKVMVIGGTSSGIQFSDEGTQLIPELWDPETGVWQELAPHSVPRNYHSTALLLKDGRIASMGGGLCGGCPTNHQNGQLYEPPYLFNANGTPAARPTLTSGEAIAAVGDVVSLQGSTDIVKFNMVRLVALTHHHTTDQRLVPLPIQNAVDGSYELAIPTNPNVVIPGYYWIFGFNSAGVPTIGHTIKINTSDSTSTTVIAGDGTVDYDYYEGTWFGLPDFDFLTPVTSGKLDAFNLTPAQRADEFAIRFTSKLYVPQDGMYTFYTVSDDGSELLINDQLVVDNNGIHAPTEQQGSLTLTAGLHDIEVGYLEYLGGQSLSVTWEGPGFARKDISSDLTTGLIELAVPHELEVPASGVNYDYFEGTWNSLPDFNTLTPVSSGNIETFSIEPAQKDDAFAFRYKARIQTETDGLYTFYTASDDGSQLFINGQLVVDNDGVHPAIEQSGSIDLLAGLHEVEVRYFEKSGGETLLVSWSGPDFEQQDIADAIVSSVTDTDTDTDSTDSQTSTPATPTAVDGIAYEYYEGAWTELPDFTTLTPVDTGIVTAFTLEPAQTDDFFAFRYTTRIDVPEDGSYTFFTRSDDGSQLFVNNQLIVDNDGLHAAVEKQGEIDLSAGLHDIVVTVMENTGLQSLDVLWSGPGFSKLPLADAVPAPAQASPPSPSTGIAYSYYEGNWNALPDFATLTPIDTGTVQTFSLAPAQREDLFALRYVASLTIQEDGDYTFFTTSDDGSQLFVNGQLIVDNDGLHASIEQQGQVTLSAGTHEIVVTLFEKTGQQSLDVNWAGPGFDKTALAPAITQ